VLFYTNINESKLYLTASIFVWVILFYIAPDVLF